MFPRKASSANYDIDWASLSIADIATLQTALDSKLSTSGGTIDNNLGVNGVLDFAETVGEKVMLYGGANIASSYGFGVEGGTLYAKSNSIYRWYIGRNADGGANDTMELSANQLTLNGEGVFTGGLTTNDEVYANLASRFGSGNFWGMRTSTNGSNHSGFYWVNDDAVLYLRHASGTTMTMSATGLNMASGVATVGSLASNGAVTATGSVVSESIVEGRNFKVKDQFNWSIGDVQAGRVGLNMFGQFSDNWQDSTVLAVEMDRGSGWETLTITDAMRNLFCGYPVAGGVTWAADVQRVRIAWRSNYTWTNAGMLMISQNWQAGGPKACTVTLLERDSVETFDSVNRTDLFTFWNLAADYFNFLRFNDHSAHNYYRMEIDISGRTENIQFTNFRSFTSRLQYGKYFNAPYIWDHDSIDFGLKAFTGVGSITTGSVSPRANTTFDLGAGNRWRYVYSQYINTDGPLRTLGTALQAGATPLVSVSYRANNNFHYELAPQDWVDAMVDAGANIATRKHYWRTGGTLTLADDADYHDIDVQDVDTAVTIPAGLSAPTVVTISRWSETGITTINVPSGETFHWFENGRQEQAGGSHTISGASGKWRFIKVSATGWLVMAD